MIPEKWNTKKDKRIKFSCSLLFTIIKALYFYNTYNQQIVKSCYLDSDANFSKISAW